MDEGDVVSHYLLHHGRYEYGTLALMHATLPKGGTFVDGGAHLGAFTIPGAKMVGPRGTVFSFEPTPSTYQLLLANVELNNLGNVVAHQTVLGETSQDVKFFASTKQAGRNSVYEVDGKPMVTPQSTLDELVPGQADLIKLDVEGSELDCLRGAKQTLAHEPILCIESAPIELGISRRVLAVFDLMADAGFKAWRFKEGATGCRPRLIPVSRPEVATRDDNLVFCTQEHRLRDLL